MAPADTLVCDTAQVAAWQSDPAFAYSRELIAPEINVLEWFSRWFGKLLDKIFGNTLVAEYSEVVLICIAVLILVLVIWFVYKKRPELFMRSRKSTLPYTVGGGHHLWSGFCGKNCRCACPDGLSGGGAFALSADAETAQRWKTYRLAVI